MGMIFYSCITPTAQSREHITICANTILLNKTENIYIQ